MATAAGLTVITGLAYFGYYKLDDLTRKYSRRRRPKRFGSIKGKIPKKTSALSKLTAKIPKRRKK